MKATIISGQVKTETGKIYPITKDQDEKDFSEGQEVNVRIGTEYPKHCDENPMCEGDETCIACLMTVATIIK